MAVVFDSLQQREVFHLAFLRAFVRAVPPQRFALKGGSNLRFFFGSIRYSEDMDMDVDGVTVATMQEKAMIILRSAGLMDTLRVYGIARVVPPDMRTAKQTETVQRFKVHLLTTAGADLPAKIEFSRRGLDTPIRSEPISPAILSTYRMPPLIAPHYPAGTAARQKISALASRKKPEARDIFDLHSLSTHPEVQRLDLGVDLPDSVIREARERIFALDYVVYRDTVVDFLGPADRPAYDSPRVWDQIRLAVVELLERLGDREN